MLVLIVIVSVLFTISMCCFILSGHFLYAAMCFFANIATMLFLAYIEAYLDQRKSAASAAAAPAFVAANVRKADEYAIAGASNYQDAILSLCDETDEYQSSQRALIEQGMTDERIYRYQIQPSIADHVRLIPEPENPYDANAIRVELSGVHVGYIKRGQTIKIRELLDAGSISYMYIDLVGGPYKVIAEDEENPGNYATETVPDHTIGLRLWVTPRE